MDLNIAILLIIGIIFSPIIEAYTVRNNPSGIGLKAGSRNPIDENVAEQQAVPVYIASAFAVPGQVLGVITGRPGSYLYFYPPDTFLQQEWIIDLADKSTNQYFIRLSSNPKMVIESPVFPGRAYIWEQVNSKRNQLWEFEIAPGFSWRLKNSDTGYNLYMGDFAIGLGTVVEVADDDTTNLPRKNSYWVTTPPNQ